MLLPKQRDANVEPQRQIIPHVQGPEVVLMALKNVQVHLSDVSAGLP